MSKMDDAMTDYRALDEDFHHQKVKIEVEGCVSRFGKNVLSQVRYPDSINLKKLLHLSTTCVLLYVYPTSRYIVGQ